MTTRKEGADTPSPIVGTERILFVSLTNDVGSDRVVSDLGRQGALCAVLGPSACFAALSRVVAARFVLPSTFGSWGSTRALRSSLAAAVASFRPSRIVPLDELAALTLRTTARDGATPATLVDTLVRSLGRLDGFDAACHRVPLMVAAKRAGVRVPAFGIADHDDVRTDPQLFPLYVKRDHSSGSGGVVRVGSIRALSAALRQARLKRWIKRMMARAAGYRHGHAPILLQQAVSGTLAMRTVTCRNGKVLDGISFVATEVHPTKRASTMLRAIENIEMDRAACTLVEALGCSGFVSFDFIVDDQDRAFLIEMNARPIGSTHLGRLFGHDLCGAFLSGQPIPVGKRADGLAPGQKIALFPKELERDPAGACLERDPGVFHDVPRDEPDLVDAYIRHLVGNSPILEADLRMRLGLRPTSVPAAETWPPRAVSQAFP